MQCHGRFFFQTEKLVCLFSESWVGFSKFPERSNTINQCRKMPVWVCWRNKLRFTIKQENLQSKEIKITLTSSLDDEIYFLFDKIITHTHLLLPIIFNSQWVRWSQGWLLAVFLKLSWPEKRLVGTCNSLFGVKDDWLLIFMLALFWSRSWRVAHIFIALAWTGCKKLMVTHTICYIISTTQKIFEANFGSMMKCLRIPQNNFMIEFRISCFKQ